MLIHIEVQTQREANFPKRMYRYNTRIADRYDRTVVSLAVLADDDPTWRPDHHSESLWGWSVRMSWPSLKLLDYANRVAELEASKNPFAKVVLAHLKTLETRADPANRRSWKMRLMRGLYEQGFSSEDIRQLFRMIDWMMELPSLVQQQFEQELDEYKEGRRMPFVDSIERRGMLKMLEVILRTKFGEEGIALVPAIRELNDAKKYEDLSRTIVTAETVDEVRKACTKATAAAARRARRRGSSQT